MIDDEWEVELMRAVINGGVFNVSVTSTGEGSDPGAWGGRFYGPPNDGAETDPQAVMPDSVAGTFNAPLQQWARCRCLRGDDSRRRRVTVLRCTSWGGGLGRRPFSFLPTIVRELR